MCWGWRGSWGIGRGGCIGTRMSGSGSINLGDLTILISSTSDGIYTNPSQGIISAGTDGFDATLYTGVSGPASFGAGANNEFADAFAGEYFLIAGSFGALALN